MGQMNTDLAALIGSRICHDLISPIGAINNGLELLTMSGTPRGPEIGLIGESVDNASARIRFFRIAFGAAGEQRVGPVEVNSILRDLYGASRLDVIWQPDEAVDRREVRLCFLALLCAETALPWGGRVSLARQDGSWCLTGEADRVNVEADLWRVLSDGSRPGMLQPSQVQFALLPLIAADLGRRVTCRSDTTSVAISF